MKQKTWIAISLTTLILYLMSSSKTFANIVRTQKMRLCDPSGCGNYGASRGSRKHSGVDVVVIPGENIFSPISGKVTRHGIAYSDDNRFKLIEIANTTHKVKLLYVNPTVQPGTQVRAGQIVATAQDISQKYTSKMTPHVHIDVYENNVKINPTKLLNL